MCRLPKPLLCNATDDLLLHSFFTKHFVSPVFNYCFSVPDLLASVIQSILELSAQQGTFPCFFIQVELIVVDGVVSFGNDGQQVAVLTASLLQLSARRHKKANNEWLQ